MVYNNCIVCVLDILGYRDLIKEKSPEELHGILSRCISTLDELKEKYPASTIFVDKIRVQVVGDIILLLLDLENLPSVEELQKKYAPRAKDSEAYFMEYFFWFVFNFVLQFIYTVKYLLRGGVTRGRYVQDKINIAENQFIHSEAMVSAVELEKQAVNPRIVLSDALVKFIMEKESKYALFPSFYRCSDGLYCLETYGYLQHLPVRYCEESISRIKIVVENQISKNERKTEILKKYCWFATYHNDKLIKISAEFQEFAFLRNYTIKVPDYLSL